jgi:hypothetical protein
LGMCFIPQSARSPCRNGTSDTRQLETIQHKMEGNIDDRDS